MAKELVYTSEISMGYTYELSSSFEKAAVTYEKKQCTATRIHTQYPSSIMQSNNVFQEKTTSNFLLRDISLLSQKCKFSQSEIISKIYCFFYVTCRNNQNFMSSIQQSVVDLLQLQRIHTHRRLYMC